MRLITEIIRKFMKSLPGAKMVNNCEIAIIGIEKNKIIHCPSQCTYADSPCDIGCDIKKTIKVKQTKSFAATVVSINEKNLGYNGSFSCHLRSDNITLIDSDGFSYSGKIMCEELNPLRFSPEFTDVHLYSQANFSVIFPQLPSKVEVSRIIVKADIYSEEYADFEIGNMISSNDGGDI